MKSNSITHWVLIVAGLFALSCAPEGRVPVVGTETDNATLIYGDDDRIEYYEGTAAQQAAAEAVFVVVNNSELNCAGGVCTLDTVPFTDWFAEGLCEDEPFRTQPTVGHCTAFLVGEDLVATAGHCLGRRDCRNISFVPRFRVESAGGAAPTAIPEAEVLRCGDKVVRKLKGSDDYAVYSLQTPAVGITPLCIRRSGEVPVDTELVIIGHPYTIPVKIAGGAQVQGIASNYFTANLDDYGGNSGSPVFDAATMEVQGILVRGNEDFVFDSGAGCWRSNVCPDTGCPGFEEVSHARKIDGDVPDVPCFVPAACVDASDCDDGDLCNGEEICGSGGCEAGPPVVCDDGIFCNGLETCEPTTGLCSGGQTVVCDDGDFCNGEETCGTGGCEAGTPVVCADDGDPCTTEVCDSELGCIAGPPVDCDDGDFCNGEEFCGAGGCAAGTPVVCADDGDPCTDEFCDSVSAGCVSEDNGTCVPDDVVTVSLAKYTKNKSKLEVRANSTLQPDVDLTVTFTVAAVPYSFGMTYSSGKQRYELKATGVGRPDGDVITVTSSAGGSVIKSIQVK